MPKLSHARGMSHRVTLFYSKTVVFVFTIENGYWALCLPQKTIFGLEKPSGMTMPFFVKIFSKKKAEFGLRYYTVFGGWEICSFKIMEII